MNVAPQHLLSVSRVVLGGFVLGALTAHARSALVLPAVVAACAADYADGIVARRRGDDSVAGRLLDNICDATFLALTFGALACAHAFSGEAADGAAALAVDWSPLGGLALSFGSYLYRWAAVRAAHGTPRRSAFGHRAGVLNYALAIAGAVAVMPGPPLAPALFYAACALGVAFFNVLAGLDNLRRLLRGE